MGRALLCAPYFSTVVLAANTLIHSGDEAAKKEAAKPDEEKPGTKPATKPEPKDPLDLDKAVQAVEIVLEFPRAAPRGTVALRHATVITMKGEEVLRDADVVVTDNRIAAIGRSGAVRIPSGAREVDVRSIMSSAATR